MDEAIAQVTQNLRESVSELNSRGLFTAAKWSSEQLLGTKQVALDTNGMEGHKHKNGFKGNGSSSDEDLISFAGSLLSLSEFQRCAFLFRDNSNLKPNLSLKSIFIACYSMYMAGEKLKDQLVYESKSVNVNSSSDDKKAFNQQGSEGSSAVRNPYLNDLFNDLCPMYDKYVSYQGEEHCFMDGFTLYIFATVVRDLRSKSQNRYFPDHARLANLPATDKLYAQAAIEYPYNWSAWLDLTAYCSSEEIPLPPPLSNLAALALSSSSFILVPISADSSASINHTSLEQFCTSGHKKILFFCFLLHHFTFMQKPNDSLIIFHQIKDIFPESLWIHSQAALVYYHLRNFDESQTIFERIRNSDPYRIQLLDIFSNILYVKEERAQLSHLAHVLTKIDKFSPETCCVIGNYYSLIRKHDKAIVYFKRALKLNKNFISAHTLMGHEYVELRNTSAAIYCYRQALEISSSDYRAWYGLGQTYEILNLYQYALYYFKKASTLRSEDARMWCAVANCLHKLGASDDAIVEYEKAIKLGDAEGVATRELARLYEEAGSIDQAAQVYKQYVDTDASVTDTSYTDTAVKPRQFNTQRDYQNKDGIIFLAKYYRHRRRYDSVYKYCSRLLDLHGPEGDEARAMMREVRARADGVSAADVSLDFDESDVRSRLSMGSIEFEMEDSLDEK